MTMRTGAELARLRRRLTVLYTATAAVGLVALATITTTIEARLRAERTDQELVGWAARAASLVDDATGDLDPAAIEDDVVNERVAWAAFTRSGASGVVEIGGSERMDGAAALASRSAQDDEERGTFGHVAIGGDRTRAAAMPLFVGDEVRGSVVVAGTPATTSGSTLARDVWVATVALIAFGGFAGWWLAGRSIRPAAASLEHHEQFLAAAAHELRTPLARVRAVGESVGLLAADLVAAADGDRDERDELAFEVARLRSLTVEASAAVEQLLLIAQVDAGSVRLRREPVRLADLAVAVSRDHPDVDVRLTSSAVVMGDPTMLALAIGNLVTNAERHARPGGEGPIVLAVDDVGDVGDVVAVSVADSGRGFDPGALAHVFERFRSGSPGGVGLGLWLVRWIAEQHGGSVRAANRPEGGAIVTIELPPATRVE